MNALQQALEFYSQGRRDLAAETCNAILAKDPDYGEAHHLLGVIALQKGENATARSLIAKATRSAGATAEMFHNLGTALTALGDADAACKAYERALAIKPSSAETLTKLGALYRSKQHIAPAIKLFRRALAIDPNHALAKANLRAAYCDVVPGWHFSMLEDRRRSDAFEAAINRAARGKKVLDIGAGAGLLTLMAARAGAERVTACEANPVIAEQAQKIVERNGFASRAKVWPKYSHDLEVGRELPDRAELLVSEILSSNLINEGLIPTIEHAHQHLLKPDVEVIPRACSAMGHLIGGDHLKRYLYIDEVSGFDLSLFDEFASPNKQIHLDRHPHDVLSDDLELIHFDLTGKSGPMAPRELRHEVEVTRTGLCIGVGQWLRLDLDGITSYENRPDPETESPGAWTHMVYRFQKPRFVHPGDRLTLLTRCSRVQIRVELAEEAMPFVN